MDSNTDVINMLRKYRIHINDKSNGIALFDLISSFIGAYLLDYFFNISNTLFGNIVKNKNYVKIVYYLSIIPIGVIFHILFKQKTFLNTQLLNDSNLNIYKIIVLILIIGMIYYTLIN